MRFRLRCTGWVAVVVVEGEITRKRNGLETIARHLGEMRDDR